MSQYERMVSYLYRYQREEKEANVGYVRIERRGEMCRFSIQMRAMALQKAPIVYLYKQFADRIETITAGNMSVRNGSFWFKGISSAKRLFQTEVAFEQVDGIFIDAGENIYFATSWKNDTFQKGNWDKETTDVEQWKQTTSVEEEGADKRNESSTKKDEGKSVVTEQLSEEDTVRKKQNVIEQTEQHIQEEEASAAVKKEQILQKAPEMSETFPQPVQSAEESQEMQQPEKETEETDTKEEESAKDIQMQSVCGVCPFKRKMYDYGKRILMTFPSMQPFQPNIARACVRMELQDIGCLPIASWSLSGNRFLLHGYYCYRHLIFVQMADGTYMLGVPGIYSEKDRRNGLRYGFRDFQSIGDFGKQQGAFGYWLFELPKTSTL